MLTFKGYYFWYFRFWAVMIWFAFKGGVVTVPWSWTYCVVIAGDALQSSSCVPAVNSDMLWKFLFLRWLFGCHHWCLFWIHIYLRWLQALQFFYQRWISFRSAIKLQSISNKTKTLSFLLVGKPRSSRIDTLPSWLDYNRSNLLFFYSFPIESLEIWENIANIMN